jgi:Flp pilus assembly protein TadD
MQMGGVNRKLAAAVAAAIVLSAGLFAQAPAVRHHRIVETDPLFPPEMTQAEAALEKGDYATAQPLLEKVAGANPANYQAWFDLGFLYNAVGKADDSIAAYRKSVAAKPEVFEANLNLGLMLAKANRLDAAQYLRAATMLTPTAHVEEGRARAWQSLAHVIEAEKPEEAIAAYQEAARLEPRDPEPHLSAGALLEKQGQNAAAEQEYKQALTLDSHSPDAVAGLVNLYLRQKQYAEAESLLRKLAELRPDEPNVKVQLGRVLAAAGKTDEAIAQLEDAAKTSPNDQVLHRDLGDLYFLKAKYAQAAAQYKPLVEAAPRDFDLRMGFGRALLMQHESVEAQRQFIAAANLKPDSGEAYWQLAIAANDNKDYPLILQALEARAKFEPEVPLSYFLRATAYDNLHLPKPAAENYHHFLEVANGKYPDQEWQARHRLVAIEPKKK